MAGRIALWGLAMVLLSQTACVFFEDLKERTSDEDMDSGAGSDEDSDTDDTTDSETSADTDTTTDTDTEADTDIDAGLEKCIDAGVLQYCDGCALDAANGHCWNQTQITAGWSEAVSYCEDLTLYRHTDWHLPTQKEFVDLLGGCSAEVLAGSWGTCNPCAESVVCQSIFRSTAIDSIYWSSDQNPENQSYVLNVSFSSGHLIYSSMSMNGPYKILCVRSVRLSTK